MSYALQQGDSEGNGGVVAIPEGVVATVVDVPLLLLGVLLGLQFQQELEETGHCARFKNTVLVGDLDLLMLLDTLQHASLDHSGTH